MNNVLSIAAAVSLVSAAQAQPEVRYQIIGSVSSEWTVKPWPNGHEPNLRQPMILDWIPGVGTVQSVNEYAWLFQNGTARRIRENNQQIPGLEPSAWISASFPFPSYVPTGDGGFIMNYAPEFVPGLALRTTAAGYAPSELATLANPSGRSNGITTGNNLGIGVVGGTMREIYNANTQSLAGLPNWTIPNAYFFGIDDAGRSYGFARRSAPTPAGHFVFSIANEDTGVRILVENGTPAPPYGTVATIDQTATELDGFTADGSLTIRARVQLSSSNDIIEGNWLVSADGQWTLLAPIGRPIDALPEGVTIRSYPFDLAALNRGGVFVKIARLQGPGVDPTNEFAVLRWTRETGLRMIARLGDLIPGASNGARYQAFSLLHLSDRGDLAFGSSLALYLHHPDVGTALVARTGAPVAGGIATPLQATRISTSQDPSLQRRVVDQTSTGSSGGPNWIDPQGRLYFAAFTSPHSVAYTAQLVLPCPADFNGDGFTDFFDYSDYVACFEASRCPAGRDADFNHDGFIDFFDYAAFVGAFETGCQ